MGESGGLQWGPRVSWYGCRGKSPPETGCFVNWWVNFDAPGTGKCKCDMVLFPSSTYRIAYKKFRHWRGPWQVGPHWICRWLLSGIFRLTDCNVISTWLCVVFTIRYWPSLQLDDSIKQRMLETHLSVCLAEWSRSLSCDLQLRLAYVCDC